MTLQFILDRANAYAKTEDQRRKLEDICDYPGYSEPGYSCDKGIVLTANWNDDSTYNTETSKFDVKDDTMSRLCGILERLGYGVEWSDEWMPCCECGKLVRSIGDSYSWTGYFWLEDGALICGDCVKEDYVEEYLSSLEGNSQKANLLIDDLTEYGYRQVNGIFENGLHEGMADDPVRIGQALRKAGTDRYLFSITDVSQFYTEFSVWIPEDEEIDMSIFQGENKIQHPSPAECIKRQLQGVRI